jgi:integrase
MFDKILSGEYLQCYHKSRYRDRIGLIARNLINMRYLEEVVHEHVHEWLRFSKYCDDRGIDLPFSVYAQEVGDYLRWRFPKGSQSRRRFIKASLRIFIEADDRGSFTRRIRASPKPTSALFKEWVPSYISFLNQHRGVSEKTLRKNAFALGEFTEFLDHINIHNLRNLKAKDIHDFCTNPGHRKPVTWVSYMGIIRRFLKYVFIRKGLEQDLSFAVGGAKHFRHSGLHDVLTESELHQILGGVDRSNAIGRRDYAILLLAARYGMRPSDIRKIRLDAIHWRQNQIVFRQSKTGKQLILPLLPEVSKALIDYLRDGRPSTQVRNIFIRHKAPFEPFVPDNNLSRIMINALRRAGLDQRPGSRGLYLLRHTLATRMLGANVPIKMIGDILGHTSTDSTLGYTKIDLPNLRSASLSIAEVLQ